MNDRVLELISKLNGVELRSGWKSGDDDTTEFTATTKVPLSKFRGFHEDEGSTDFHRMSMILKGVGTSSEEALEDLIGVVDKFEEIEKHQWDLE